MVGAQRLTVPGDVGPLARREGVDGSLGELCHLEVLGATMAPPKNKPEKLLENTIKQFTLAVQAISNLREMRENASKQEKSRLHREGGRFEPVTAHHRPLRGKP